ncbi:MAG: FadR/GntR family transcriptional regulator [bacterium]
MILLEPIERGSAVEGVISRIKDALVEGRLNPGDKLPTELELMDMLGVGRGTVREAIKILSAFGVVEIRRGDGTYIADSITPPSLDPLLFSLILERRTPEDLLEIREMLELDFIEKAIERATDEDFAKMEEAIEQLKEKIEAGVEDTDLLMELNLTYFLT